MFVQTYIGFTMFILSHLQAEVNTFFKTFTAVIKSENAYYRSVTCVPTVGIARSMTWLEPRASPIALAKPRWTGAENGIEYAHIYGTHTLIALLKKERRNPLFSVMHAHFI